MGQKIVFSPNCFICTEKVFARGWAVTLNFVLAVIAFSQTNAAQTDATDTV